MKQITNINSLSIQLFSFVSLLIFFNMIYFWLAWLMVSLEKEGEEEEKWMNERTNERMNINIDHQM